VVWEMEFQEMAIKALLAVEAAQMAAVKPREVPRAAQAPKPMEEKTREKEPREAVLPAAEEPREEVLPSVEAPEPAEEESKEEREQKEEASLKAWEESSRKGIHQMSHPQQ
jgi:hypothetical protein